MASNTGFCNFIQFLLFVIAIRNAAAFPEAIERTFPAYALATKADSLNSTDCHKQLDDFRNAVDHRKLWGLRILDASGEPKSGFLYGNNYWLGLRHQCLDTTNKKPLELSKSLLRNNSKYRNVEEEFPPFELNYFVAHFRHNSTLQYHVALPNENVVTLGLCLPASCSTEELGIILQKVFDERTLLIGDLYSADFRLIQVKDLEDDPKWVSGKMMFILLIIGINLLIMMVGTIYDVSFYQKNILSNEEYENSNRPDNAEDGAAGQKWRPGKMGSILRCFSAYTNTKNILTTKVGADSVTPMHGLRFLSMVWLVMTHTLFYGSDYSDNKAWAWRNSEGFATQVLSNSNVVVDTYFFLSGFVLAYLYFMSKKGKKDETRPFNYKNKAIEFFLPILKRFIRLTPAYMMAIGISEVNFGWYNQTSQFYINERPHDVCAKYWWRNLLYINNLFGRETMCLSWSWYLSNDMQFFIIGTFLLILSSMYFYTSVCILITLLISSTFLAGYIAYMHEYVPTLDALYNSLEVIYDPPWMRIGPYIVGMIAAYILIKLNNNLNLKKRTLVIGWCIGSFCNLAVLFGIWTRYTSVISAAIYVALGRTVWAIGLAWLVIACCTKHGGIINTILSFKGWLPLSRLTFCAYLLNPFVINSIRLHSETALHVDFLPNVSDFFGNLMVTFFCAYAFSLMFEAPYILLMRLLAGAVDRKI